MRIESPCIKLCAIEAASGLCAGCRRTMDEIRRWAAMSPKERADIMARLPERQSTITTTSGVA